MVNWSSILKQGKCYLYGVNGLGTDGIFRGIYRGYENGFLIFEISNLTLTKGEKMYVNPDMIVFVQKSSMNE